MNRFPRWARFVLGAALTLALGAGGALLGIRFATPTENVVAETTEAIVAPEVPAALATDQADDDYLTTVQQALPDAPTYETVTVGEDAAGEAARLDAFLDAVAESADPVLSAPALLPIYELGGSDDPCAGDSPPADCPEGVESTVLRYDFDTLPAPQILSAGLAVEGGFAAECAQPGTDVLAVTGNVPGAIIVNYWEDVVVEPTVTAFATDERYAAWQEQFRTRTAGLPWPTILTCVPLGPLTAGTTYQAHIVLQTEDSEVSTYRRISFTTANPTVRPAAMIFTAADDLIIATVPHKAGDRVQVTPHVLTLDEPVRCDREGEADDRFVVRMGRDRDYAVPAADLLFRGEDPAYAERVTAAFGAAEGLRILICVAVLPAGGSSPDYTASAVVYTADRLVPLVTVYSANGAQRDVGGFEVRANTGNGSRCGRWSTTHYPSHEIFDPQPVLCDYAQLTGSPTARMGTTPGSLPFSRGLLDRMVITLDPHDGDELPVTNVIDLASLPAGACRGACTEPRDSYFHMVWSKEYNHFFYTDSDTITFTARVSWTQGNVNGSGRTTVNSFTDSFDAGEAPLMPAPVLDTDVARLVFSSYTAFDRAWTANVTIAADQPGTWTASLYAAPGTGPLCSRPYPLFTQSGVIGTEPVTTGFRGLCQGADYRLRVILTGETGVQSIWGASPDESGVPTAIYGGDWGPRGRLHTPEMPVQISLSSSYVNVNGDPDSESAIYATLNVNGRPLFDTPRGGCFNGSVAYVAPAQTIEVRLPEVLRLTGELQAGWDQAIGSVCNPRPNGWAHRYPTSFAGTVTLDQVLSGSGVSFMVDAEPRNYPLTPEVVDRYAGSVQAAFFFRGVNAS